MTLRIDLNCDMGEYDSGDVSSARRDAAILAFVSSASISCGAHAGDAAVMAATIRSAAAAGVSIGAHPGFADRAHFGRREQPVTPDDVYGIVREQLRVFSRIAASEGAAIDHVKPHGALYNMAALDPLLARATASAIRDTDPALVLYGLAGSELVRAGTAAGLAVAAEAFADRTYENDGSLTPRSIEGAVLENPAVIAERVVRMVARGSVETRQGNEFALAPDTVCVHSDSPNALASIRMIRAALESAGIRVAAPGRA